MKCLGTVAAATHGDREFVDVGSGLAEDDGRRWILQVENAPERLGLMGLVDDIDLLIDQFTVLGCGCCADLDHDGVLLVTLRNRMNARWHRCGEQHCLAIVRRVVEDQFDVFGEAHVEHLVGLVEHDRAHLVKIERATLQMVDRSTRRGDNHVHAAPESIELAADRLASVDRGDLDS